MKNLLIVAKRFLKEEDAPTMVEYGLMLALIAVVVHRCRSHSWYNYARRLQRRRHQSWFVPI